MAIVASASAPTLGAIRLAVGTGGGVARRCVPTRTRVMSTSTGARCRTASPVRPTEWLRADPGRVLASTAARWRPASRLKAGRGDRVESTMETCAPTPGRRSALQGEMLRLVRGAPRTMVPRRAPIRRSMGGSPRSKRRDGAPRRRCSASPAPRAVRRPRCPSSRQRAATSTAPRVTAPVAPRPEHGRRFNLVRRAPPPRADSPFSQSRSSFRG